MEIALFVSEGRAFTAVERLRFLSRKKTHRVLPHKERGEIKGYKVMAVSKDGAAPAYVTEQDVQRLGL